MNLRASRALALGWALLLLPYLPLVLQGRTFLSDDAAHFEVPMLTFMRQSWGETWYPWSEGGLPVVGYTLGRLLYLPQAFFALVPPLEGTVFYLVLNQVAALGFAFLYLRHRRTRPLPAMLGALAYAGSAAWFHFAINFVFYPILVLAPLLLYFLERTLERPGPRPALGASLTLAMLLSGGGWQITAVYLSNILAWGLVWALSSRRRRARLLRAAAWLALALVLALAWCAPVTNSLRELYAQEVIRSVPFDPARAGAHGLVQELSWQALYSPFSGPLEQLNRERGLNAHEFVAIPGVALLPLWLLGLRPRKGRRLWVACWTALLVVDAFFALGTANPVYRWLQDQLPVLSNFRVPVRLLTPFPLLLMGLVAFGAERLRGRTWLGWLGIVYYGLYWIAGRPEWTAANLLLLASVLCAGALGSLQGRARQAALLAAALCQVWAPLLFVQGQYFLDTHTVRQEIALLSELKQRLPNPLVGIFYGINPESPTLVAVRNACGFSPFMLRRHADYLFVALHGREMTPEEFQFLLFQNFHPLHMLQGSRPDWYATPMGRMLCTAFLVTPERADPLPLAYPGFWFSREAEPVPDPVQARRRMTGPGFDPLRTVLLDRPAPEKPAWSSGQPRLVEYRPSRLVLEPGGQSGWLTLVQAEYPGWVARVDGKATPIYRGNTVFQTIPIQPGSKRLEVEFTTPAFDRGLPFLALSVVGWAALALWSFRRDP